MIFQCDVTIFQCDVIGGRNDFEHKVISVFDPSVHFQPGKVGLK